MGTVYAWKMLESLERDVIPAMLVGVISKNEEWLAHTLNDTLPNLEERAFGWRESAGRAGNTPGARRCARRRACGLRLPE